MKKSLYLLFFVMLVGVDLHAQGARNASVGLVMLDPMGLTAKIPVAPVRAVALSFGPDYFGSPRLQADYLWDIPRYRRGILTPYAGPGVAVAFAKGISPFFSKELKHEWFANAEDKTFAVGARAIVGMNITPRHSPMEFYFEAGPLIPFTRTFDLDIDAGIGARYKL